MTMETFTLQASPETYNALRMQALGCTELWNMAMTQRRNKYSWGKANAQTQIEELQELQDLEPRLQAIPLSALKQVIEDLDEAYALFLEANTAFKKHQRDTRPEPPQPLAEENLYPLFYSANFYTLQEAQIILQPHPEASLLPLIVSERLLPSPLPPLHLEGTAGFWLLLEEENQGQVLLCTERPA